MFSLGGQDDYAFSPDGQEICYTSNHDKNPAASTNNDLWIVPVNGGPAKNITADNPASDSTPLYSPDGRYIAYRAQQRPGYESDRFRLMLYDRKTGEKKNLTEDFDEWVGTFVLVARFEAILFFAAENEGSVTNSVRSCNRPCNLRLHRCRRIQWLTSLTPDRIRARFRHRMSTLPSGHCRRSRI